MKILKVATLSFLLLLTACSIELQEIEYGKDVCNYCNMTIVDHQHAASVLTNKGRTHKYDSIECMLNGSKEMKAADINMIMVADYSNLDSMIDATKAYFLVSDYIPSPMGANLSAFVSESDMNSAINDKGGIPYDWESIKKHIQ